MKEMYSNEANQKRAISLSEWWRSLSEEEKTLVNARRSVSAKRRWAMRSQEERDAIGKKISKAKRERS